MFVFMYKRSLAERYLAYSLVYRGVMRRLSTLANSTTVDAQRMRIIVDALFSTHQEDKDGYMPRPVVRIKYQVVVGMN